MSEIAYVSNDSLLKLDGLEDEAATTTTYINDATVTATLVDEDGANVSGQSWPVTLSYVAASNGNYRATLEDVLVLSHGSNYTAKITANGGAGLMGYWELPIAAETRRS